MDESKKDIKIEQNYEQSIEKLCDMTLEQAKEGYQSQLEPWEAFEARKRAQVKENMNKLKNRFARGYKALLEELTKESSQKALPQGPLGHGPQGMIRP